MQHSKVPEENIAIVENMVSEFQGAGSEEPTDAANFVEEPILISEIFATSQDGSNEPIDTLTPEIWKQVSLVEMIKTYSPRAKGVGFQLSWIASRYLELCMFKYIQDCINSRKELSDSKLETIAALILRIISTTERPILTPGALQSNELRSMVYDFNDRQGRIKAALWVYCSKVISNLSLNDFWSRHRNDLPILNAKGMPQRFWESLESFDDQQIPTLRLWSWRVQPFYHERATVAKVLDKIKQFITTTELQGSEQAFKSMFKDMAIGFLDDLALGTFGHRPECNLPKASRLFLALVNLSWSFEHIDVVGHAFRPEGSHQGDMNPDQTMYGDSKIIRFAEYIRFKIFTREALIRLYNIMLEMQGSTMLRSEKFKREVERTNLQSYDDPKSVSMHHLMMKGCCIGRRWEILMEIAGEAIILCGSPLITPSSDSSIPKIVETGSKEDFARLCSALNTDMQWVKEVCGQLKGVRATLKETFTWIYDKPEDLCEVVSKKRRQTVINLHESIIGAFEYEASPVSLLSGELRSMGLGIPAQEIIRQLQNDGLLSSSLQKQHFSESLSLISELIAHRDWRSKVELAVARGVLRLFLAGTELSPLAVYIEKVFDNLWF